MRFITKYTFLIIFFALFSGALQCASKNTPFDVTPLQIIETLAKLRSLTPCYIKNGYKLSLVYKISKPDIDNILIKITATLPSGESAGEATLDPNSPIYYDNVYLYLLKTTKFREHGIGTILFACAKEIADHLSRKLFLDAMPQDVTVPLDNLIEFYTKRGAVIIEQDLNYATLCYTPPALQQPSFIASSVSSPQREESKEQKK